MNPLSKAEQESERIKKGLCPKCGSAMKDKGSYIRCTSCTFAVTDGTWNQEEGWCSQAKDEP